MFIVFYEHAVCERDTKIEKGLLDDVKKEISLLFHSKSMRQHRFYLKNRSKRGFLDYQVMSHKAPNGHTYSLREVIICFLILVTFDNSCCVIFKSFLRKYSGQRYSDYTNWYSCLLATSFSL